MKSKLPSWKKIRKAKVGDLVAFGRDTACYAYQVNSGGLYGTTTINRCRFKRGVVGEVFAMSPKKDILWISIGGWGHGIPAEHVRKFGGVFPDQLRAEVALQTGAL